jgi:hypothetical protein
MMAVTRQRIKTLYRKEGVLPLAVVEDSAGDYKKL